MFVAPMSNNVALGGTGRRSLFVPGIGGGDGTRARISSDTGYHIDFIKKLQLVLPK